MFFCDGKNEVDFFIVIGLIICFLVNFIFVLIICFFYVKVEKYEKIKGKLEIFFSGKRWKGRMGLEFVVRCYLICIGCIKLEF